MATLNCILHPHHTSLIRQPYTIQSLLHSYADHIDPYYEFDRIPSHKGVSVPRFNVTETKSEYHLAGEIPGVTDKSSITVEWLLNQVLIIRGEIPLKNEVLQDDVNELAPAGGTCYSILSFFH